MPSTSLTSLYKPRRRRKLFFLSGTALILFFVVFALIVLLNLWIISRSSTTSSSYRTAHNNELRAGAVPPPKKAGFRSISNSGGAVVVTSARKEENVAREHRLGHKSAETTPTSSTSTATTTTTRTTRREKVIKKEKRKKPSPRRSSTTTGGAATSGNRFAYAFTVGCKPANRSCITYIYNILVAARILREAGSEADIVAFFQLSAESKTTTRLSDQVCRWFKVMNVRLYYIPKYKKATYYSMVMQKFRILSLTEYSRVIFMDADVMPVGDLGYLFELSVRGILKENFIITSAAEPANGGFFMLAPRNDSIANINTIVRKREAAAKSMGKPWFDEVKGWGREIRPPDRWETHGKSGGTKWSFYAAFADQGLLYHYTKYVRKSVSIVLGSRVQNWGPDPNDPDSGVALEETLENVFTTNNSKASPYYRPPMYPGVVHNCKFWSGPTGCWPPFDSFIHFSGGGATKPWWHKPPKYNDNTTTALGVWYHQLSRLNRELNMGLDLENNWTTEGGGTPLGVRPMPFQATFAKTNLLTKVERDFRAA